MSAALTIAGIVAKGLGIIFGIFAFGFVVGVILTAMIAGRFRSRRNR